jgi:hypothetical protein
LQHLRYHIASGSIVARLGLDPICAVEEHPEYALIEGDASPETHWIDDGEIIARTIHDGAVSVDQIEDGSTSVPVITGLPADCWMRIRGTANMRFPERLEAVSGGTLMFVPEVPGRYVVTLMGRYAEPEMTFEVVPLDTLKQRRKDEVTARKALASRAGVKWEGHRWDASADALSAVKSYLGMPLPEGFYWTDFEGVDVPIDEAGLAALAGAIVTFTFAVHDRSRALKDMIQSAALADEVRAVDVDAGWPT